MLWTGCAFQLHYQCRVIVQHAQKNGAGLVCDSACRTQNQDRYHQFVTAHTLLTRITKKIHSLMRDLSSFMWTKMLFSLRRPPRWWVVIQNCNGLYRLIMPLTTSLPNILLASPKIPKSQNKDRPDRTNQWGVKKRLRITNMASLPLRMPDKYCESLTKHKLKRRAWK